MSAMRPNFSDIVWPDAAAYWIANARVPLCMLGEARLGLGEAGPAAQSGLAGRGEPRA